jgi:hypothetical protein
LRPEEAPKGSQLVFLRGGAKVFKVQTQGFRCRFDGRIIQSGGGTRLSRFFERFFK